MAEFFKPRDVVHRFRSGKRETLTVSNSVKTLTASAYTYAASGAASGPQLGPKSATGAVIQVQAQPIRFTLDGTNPVATTTGFLAAAGDQIYLNSQQELQSFKAIRDGGTDASCEVHYQFGF